MRAQLPASEAKLEREACESFVAGDYARWILGAAAGDRVHGQSAAPTNAAEIRQRYSQANHLWASHA